MVARPASVGASPTSRSDGVRVRRRAGSGRFGRRASASCSSASTAASSSASAFARAGDLPHARDRVVGVLALVLGGGDRVVGLVLLAAQRLELRQDRAAALVEREHAVEPAVRHRAARARRGRRPGRRAAASGRARRPRRTSAAGAARQRRARDGRAGRRGGRSASAGRSTWR